jgi:predicted acylesterase/phospholipase RssA
MDPFPVDVMRALCGGGSVIGINTSPKREKLRAYEFGPSVSGWQILWSKLNPLARKRRAPSILSSLLRASEINGIYRNKALAAAADLVIQPPVEAYGSLDFGAYAEIIAIGYEEAKKRLAAG